MAEADSILHDFQMSKHFKNKESDKTSTHKEREYDCPICHTIFKEYDYYCPSCTLSVEAIKSNDEQEIKIKTKLFQMSDEERSKYNDAFQTLITEKGRAFLTPAEQLQFFKNYGILD